MGLSLRSLPSGSSVLTCSLPDRDVSMGGSWSGPGLGGGLKWGSSVAARYRVVRDDHTRGSIVICSTRRASIVARPQRARVHVTRCRESCGYGLPMRRGGHLCWPAQLLRLTGPECQIHGRTGCQPGSAANSDGFAADGRRGLPTVRGTSLTVCRRLVPPPNTSSNGA